MSGIYIPGMEMPKTWRDCLFSNGAAQCKIDNMELCGLCYRQRCPLVPVPDHGGLVDLKAPFCAQYYDEMTEEWIEKEVTVEDVLFDSMVYDMPPVVIQASKGEPE